MPFMYHEEYSAYSQEEERISEAWMRASRCRGGFEIETTMGEIRSWRDRVLLYAKAENTQKKKSSPLIIMKPIDKRKDEVQKV